MDTKPNVEPAVAINPEEVVQEYIYAKDNHQWDKLTSLLDPDYTSSDPDIPEPVKGIQAVSQYFPMLEQVDMKTKILTMMSKGEDVAAELAVTCTIQENGKPRSFTITFAKFYRVNSKGLLADEREYSDTATKFKAMGQMASGEFESYNSEQEAANPGATEVKTEMQADTEKSTVVAGGLTPKVIFETKIPVNLNANLDKLADVNAICQFIISGDAGGSWYVDMTVKPPVVIAGTSDKAKCTIACSDTELVAIMSGKANATLAVMTGKVKISGDMSLAASLRMILAV